MKILNKYFQILFEEEFFPIKNLWFKYLVEISYFATIEMCDQSLLQKFSVQYKIFFTNISDEKHFPIKNFQPKILMEFFTGELLLRKWFSKHKKFSTKLFESRKFLIKIIIFEWYFKRDTLSHHKYSTKIFLMKLFGEKLFRFQEKNLNVNWDLNLGSPDH